MKGGSNSCWRMRCGVEAAGAAGSRIGRTRPGLMMVDGGRNGSGGRKEEMELQVASEMKLDAHTAARR